MTDLNDFQLPPTPETKNHPLLSHASAGPQATRLGKLHTAIIRLSQKLFGRHSTVTQYLKTLDPTPLPDGTADPLLSLKKSRGGIEKVQSALAFVLLILILLTWKSTVPLLRESDQLRNDLKEQQQLLDVEQKNQASLKKLAGSQEALEDDLQHLHAAVPEADEKAEEVISMLEAMAAHNRMVIEGIGIRKIPESQVNDDALRGVVDVYEYTFGLESSFEAISSFLQSVRNSFRLMDVISMEMEEKKGLYRASIVLYVYHLTP